MNTQLINEKILSFGFELAKRGFKVEFLANKEKSEIKYLIFHNEQICQWHIVRYRASAENQYSFDIGDLHYPYPSYVKDKLHPEVSDVTNGQYYMLSEFNQQKLNQFLLNAAEVDNDNDNRDNIVPQKAREEILEKWIAAQGLTKLALNIK